MADRGMSITAAGVVLGCSGSSMRDALERGLLVKAADRFAMKAGYHPAEVWPTWHDDAVEDHGRPCDECGTVFIAYRKDQRFCSRPCNRRWWAKVSVKKRRQTPEGQAENRERRRRYYADPANRAYELARERRRYYAKKIESQPCSYDFAGTTIGAENECCPAACDDRAAFPNPVEGSEMDERTHAVAVGEVR